jgi:hypothetical protein
MPVPKPHKGESQDDFISRCMSKLADTDPDRPNEQRLAMCFSAWREEHGGEPPKQLKQVENDDVPEPDDGEKEKDFVERCTSELTDNFDIGDAEAENICQNKWDESGNGDDDEEERIARGLVHKTHASETDGMEFTLSDETPDRIVAAETFEDRRHRGLRRRDRDAC